MYSTCYIHVICTKTCLLVCACMPTSNQHSSHGLAPSTHHNACYTDTQYTLVLLMSPYVYMYLLHLYDYRISLRSIEISCMGEKFTI